MKTDARIARYGSSHRYDPTGSVQVACHPHHARLYQITVDPAAVVSIVLPTDGARHLGKGFAFAVVNEGGGGDGDIEFLDSDMNAIVFLDGLDKLTPGRSAKVYLRAIPLMIDSEVPTWDIATKAVGASAVL